MKEWKMRISSQISSKIDKYELLTGELILPPEQKILKEQARFNYSLLG